MTTKSVKLDQENIELLNKVKGILYQKHTKRKKITDNDTIKTVLKNYLK